MSLHSTRSPLIIGGVGGSGTRVFRAISVAAGYSMLSAPWLIEKLWSEYHDNLLMRKLFYPKWTEAYLAGNADERHMRKHCRRLLWWCGPTKFERNKWGWKNPNTIHFLPFWQQIYPNLIYIHVVRDGRDIAFNKKMTYINQYNQSLFTDEEQALPEHLRKAKFWERCVERVRSWSETMDESRHLTTSFEKLCAQPTHEIRKIFDFLESDASDTQIQQAAKLVQLPKTLGRWKSAPADQVAEVEALIGATLSEFGYGKYE